ncbi:MAG: amino acid adenylation domain-containing protein [Nitrosospira multiformis]|nr:amino acid adenylation domain-containing protein [Nitrosospira multiformis]
MGKAERSIQATNSETFLFPTSFAQQRLWFFEQLYPGSTVYHLSTVLPFEGLLDRHALEESLGDLLDRHEALRTTFTALDGVPVQLIAPHLRIDMPLVDVSKPGGHCLERAREAARAALAEPFDLVRGPLLRASLLRLGHDYHWLVLVLHHIVADGWSLEVLHRDLRALYTVAPRIPFNPFPEQAIEQSIGSRFREQAEHHPDHVAIWVSNHRWTYGKLDALSNRIANAVRAVRGEGAERIALLFRDGGYMIAAMLGVLKAGKAYIPLDPAHPEARIEKLIDSSGATAVLTDVTGFSSAHAPLIPLAETECHDTNPPPPVSPDATAYILYTSGSTGEPKGVVQTHRNVLRQVRAYSNNLHICAEDRLTFVSSYGVDAAIQDVFGALLNGATLYPVSVREEGVSALVNCLVEHEITVFHSTPTVFRHLVNDIPENVLLQKLRLIALGGEAVYRRDVDLFRTHFSPDCLLVNGYGLTESTMALQYFVDHTTPLVRDAVPVGYPVDGIELLLLDETGEPAEIYCQGEIIVCGPSIALGYWRQGNVTPFPLDTNGRPFYRTGDLGRRLPDGSIEFIGRRDFQVKVRGYRIETGEIENQLLACPGVKQAAVIAEEPRNGDDERLVGYVSAQPGHALAPDGLRRHLARQLPDYLVPSTFVVLEELPTTPSGKLDRLALPTPVTLTGSFVPPQNAAEAKIAEIWRQILDIENIGIQDNFFSIGGHSLLATQIISRLRDEFGVELPLQQIFETPVIADLALVVTGAQSESVPLPAIRPLPRWRHRAKVSALGEVELSADLKALLKRFASAGSPVQAAR